jgi:hypothetical protein
VPRVWTRQGRRGGGWQPRWQPSAAYLDSRRPFCANCGAANPGCRRLSAGVGRARRLAHSRNSHLKGGCTVESPLQPIENTLGVARGRFPIRRRAFTRGRIGGAAVEARSTRPRPKSKSLHPSAPASFRNSDPLKATRPAQGPQAAASPDLPRCDTDSPTHKRPSLSWLERTSTL